MTLKEALESGKPYKRNDWQHWYKHDEQVVFNPKEVVASDWEIKNEPIVFHCDWLLSETGLVYPTTFHSEVSFKSFVGKRTRVTVEVL